MKSLQSRKDFPSQVYVAIGRERGSRGRRWTSSAEKAAEHAVVNEDRVVGEYKLVRLLRVSAEAKISEVKGL